MIFSRSRHGLSYLPGDTRTARDYQIIISARVTAQERASGRVLLDRRVAGQSTIRVGNDLVSAERQALPLVAEDLARNITGLLVDGSRGSPKAPSLRRGLPARLVREAPPGS